MQPLASCSPSPADSLLHVVMATMTSGPPPVKEGLGTTANDDGTMSELIAVSKHLVGKLIGKAGATIQSLQQDTATNIQIDQVSSCWGPTQARMARQQHSSMHLICCCCCACALSAARRQSSLVSGGLCSSDCNVFSCALFTAVHCLESFSCSSEANAQCNAWSQQCGILTKLCSKHGHRVCIPPSGSTGMAMPAMQMLSRFFSALMSRCLAVAHCSKHCAHQWAQAALQQLHHHMKAVAGCACGRQLSQNFKSRAFLPMADPHPLPRCCCCVSLSPPQNESPDHPDSKIVTLRGPAENVAQAKAAIKKLLEEAAAPQEGEVEEKISCPAGIVGRIIGRGGETIRWVNKGRGIW